MVTNDLTLQAIHHHRLQKKTIVFTNGCFDILHVGHVRYLGDAKHLGDILVVGINDDESVKRLKGPGRPLNSRLERQEVLLALRMVDYVCVFEEDTPLKLIEQVQPDVLVKGGDWPVQTIVGGDFVRAYGGKVMSLPYLEGYSTTNVMRRLRETADGSS